MIAPKILFYSLFTGYPPAITTLWLFISNLIISPQVLIMRYIDKYLLHTIINLLPIIASIFLIINLIKKRFLLAFATLTIITFPIFVENSKLYLTNWDSLWISSTQLGGSIFLWFLLIMIFFIWNKDRKLAEVGLLGIIIIFINLMAPWMLSIQTSSDDQSAFNFIHRYYTLPAVGMGLLSSAIFVFFINLAKTNFIDYINKLKQKSNFLIISQKILYSIAYLILPSIIICSIILQAFISYNFLTEAHRGGTSDKIESYWTDIKPIFENIKPDQTTVIYTENNGNLDESYIKGIFPLRVGIYLGQIQNIPKVKFIFNQKEIENIDPQNFYAFSFDGKNIVSIKDKVLKSITQ